MKPRNPNGLPRIYGIAVSEGVIDHPYSTFYAAYRALGSRPLVIVVSYDEGQTWYPVGESPVSEDVRKR